MSFTFKAKTLEAYTFKTLSEVLQNILTDVCFDLTPDGIRLLTVDNKTPPQLMVHLDLQRNNFEEYLCLKNTTIGINLQHLYKLLKSIKKKDRVTFYITSQNPSQLGICSETESGQEYYSNIKIQKLQKVDTQPPTGYNFPNLIPTNSFQKMCKDMTSISKIIKIFSKGSYITFSCEFDGMYTRHAPFGTLDESSNDEEYEDWFNTKSLTQLIKISGLNQKLKVYTSNDLPLKLSIQVGSLGILDIFIKSRPQIEHQDKHHSSHYDSY